MLYLSGWYWFQFSIMESWKMKLFKLSYFYVIQIHGDLSPDFTTINTISLPMDAMYLHARTFSTISDTTFIPMGVMYLHARMFCTLGHMSSIPMGAINFYMQELFLHSLIRLLYHPWVWCIYMQECSVHSLICLLLPWVQ